MCIQHDRRLNSQNLMPNLGKFPVFFPVSREFALESGSHETRSSASKSIFFKNLQLGFVFFVPLTPNSTANQILPIKSARILWKSKINKGGGVHSLFRDGSFTVSQLHSRRGVGTPFCG